MPGLKNKYAKIVAHICFDKELTKNRTEKNNMPHAQMSNSIETDERHRE